MEEIQEVSQEKKIKPHKLHYNCWYNGPTFFTVLLNATVAAVSYAISPANMSFTGEADFHSSL